MTLYVARHGETDYNADKRYSGSTDVPLNAKGLCQAEELAKKISAIKFDLIVSSPLLRAKQTAEIIQKTIFNVPIVIINEFSEMSAGVYEGLTQEEAQAKYPDVWARLGELREKLGSRPLDDAPTGGETLKQFDARIAAGLAKLKTEYADKKILLVCHAFAARVINRQLYGLSFKDMEAFALGNCEFVEYKL